MKQKTRLITTIISMCLVLCFVAIGVFAVKNLNMGIGGNISFSADGVEFQVSDGGFKTTAGATYENINSDDTKLKGFEMNTNTKQSDIQSKIDSWTNLNLVLNSQGDAVLTFTVTNIMPSNDLYVYIAIDLGTNLNNNMNIISNTTNQKIEYGTNNTFTFEITFVVLDTSINAGLTGFNISVAFSKQSLLQSQNKDNPETGGQSQILDYSFIEMGSLSDGTPIRWRYIADKNGVAHNSNITPNTISGYYILETPIDIRSYMLSPSKYDENFKHLESSEYSGIYGSDYATSDLRKTLTSDSFLKTLNISKNNIIYKLITSRSMQDLYQLIAFNETTSTTISAENKNFGLSLPQMQIQKDKLWLPSYNEILTLLCGGEWNNDVAKWANDYITRSSYGNAHNIQVQTPGNWAAKTIGNSTYLRPCFKIL